MKIEQQSAKRPDREHQTLFTVVTERRAGSRWLLAMLGTLMLVAALFAASPVRAQTASDKVALDLRNVTAAPTTPNSSLLGEP